MANVAKIDISINTELLKRLDAFVNNKTFKNRSHAFQIALNSTLERFEHNLLEAQCMKIDKNAESRLADEGLQQDYNQ